uniref:Cytochrome c oxidase polyprotein Vb n=1 Tax=Ornithodoros parkeri TaxID=140564 RepID=A6N9T0_ORNPR|nr:cytochrome c oxidase polyprotein Vb [Ornithodoros parkeri]
MASLVGRSLVKNARRALIINARRYKSEEKRIFDAREYACGKEKLELDAIAAGNEDPFDMRVFKRGPGTKDNPNLIPSYLEKRMIGCICEEDATVINWMWLHRGDPRRCECGHWFKLVDAKPL